MYTVSAYPESPVNISVIFLNSTSFTVNWTISDPSYNYTVIWTNLNTDVVNSFTVPENTNSYTVAGLSVNTTYNVSISFVDVCGMMITSNTITVNSKYKHIHIIVNPMQYINAQHGHMITIRKCMNK